MNFAGAPLFSPQATTCWLASTIEPGGRWLSFAQLICGMLYWMLGGSTDTSAPVSVVNGSKSCAASPVTWLGSWTWEAICSASPSLATTCSRSLRISGLIVDDGLGLPDPL